MLFCFGKRDPPTLTRDQETILNEMESLARFMDTTWVTVCGKTFGADAVIGLIPVVGDVLTSAVTLWIVMRAWYAFDPRLFRRTWCIMLFNVGLDFCLGVIPLAGDIFDVYWKANVRNINLVRKHYGMEPMPQLPKPEPTTTKNKAPTSDEKQQQTKGSLKKPKTEKTTSREVPVESNV
jgi:Domain of unknown function (DUF4112)